MTRLCSFFCSSLLFPFLSFAPTLDLPLPTIHLLISLSNTTTARLTTKASTQSTPSKLRLSVRSFNIRRHFPVIRPLFSPLSDSGYSHHLHDSPHKQLIRLVVSGPLFSDFGGRGCRLDHLYMPLTSSLDSPSSCLGGCASSWSSLKLLVTVFAVWALGLVLIQRTVGLDVSTFSAHAASGRLLANTIPLPDCPGFEVIVKAGG